MTRIVTVLRSGGDFKASHVQALARQVERRSFTERFQVLSDVLVEGVETLPLKHKWPSWWSKMNLVDPDMEGDFLFLDLDTVIPGSLDDILAVKKLTLLRDFYRDGKKLKEGLGGGLIYFPADRSVCQPVWDYFTANPALAMRLYCRGDQHLFERFWLQSAARWQDVVPGQVVSWKVHCQNGVPPAARVICMHGQPRPWAVPQFLHLYR